MKRSFGKYVLRSLLYIIGMNALLFLLCFVFDADFEPNLIMNVVVPVLCASASVWAEDLRQKRWISRTE